MTKGHWPLILCLQKSSLSSLFLLWLLLFSSCFGFFFLLFVFLFNTLKRLGLSFSTLVQPSCSPLFCMNCCCWWGSCITVFFEHFPFPSLINFSPLFGCLIILLFSLYSGKTYPSSHLLFFWAALPHPQLCALQSWSQWWCPPSASPAFPCAISPFCTVTLCKQCNTRTQCTEPWWEAEPCTSVHCPTTPVLADSSAWRGHAMVEHVHNSFQPHLSQCWV